MVKGGVEPPSHVSIVAATTPPLPNRAARKTTLTSEVVVKGGIEPPT